MTVKLGKIEWLLIIAIGAVLAAIIGGIVRKKPKIVPRDVVHQPFYQLMLHPVGKTAVEAGCPNCHSRYALPQPKGHTAEVHCLTCHKMPQDQ